MSLTLTIAGTDYLPQYKTNSAKINERLGNKINTLSLQITKKTGQNLPQEGQEVILKDGSRFLFGGHITEIDPLEIGEGQLFIYNIEVSEYGHLLVNKNAQATYENQTLKFIVEDLLSDNVDSGYGFTTTNVQTGPTIETISFNHINLRKCFEKLAKITGYEWFVDYEKKVYFQNKEHENAPENFTDTSDNFFDISILFDSSQVRNSIVVRGGREEATSDKVESFSADGEQTSFKLEQKPVGITYIKVNTVAKVFAVDNINDETGNDFMWNSNEKYIRTTVAFGAPTSGDVIEVSYQYKIPVIIQLKRSSSILTMKTLEGGDGVHDFTITETSLKSKQEARLRALKELDEFADPIVKATLRTRTGLLTAGSVFRPGQILTVNLPSWNINSDTDYLIQDVSITLLEDGSNIEYNYTIIFGGRLLGLREWLEGLAAEEKIVTDTEEIDRIETIQEDLLITETIKRNANTQSISETVSIAETITEVRNIPPFKWMPSGTNPARWGLFEWG